MIPDPSREDRFFFHLLLFLLFYDYVKPDQLLPFLKAARLPLITAFLLLLFLIKKLLFGQDKKEWFDSLSILQLLFAGSMALSTAFAYVRYTSYITFVDQLKIVQFYFLIVILVNSKERFLKFIWTWLLCLFIGALVGLSLYLRGKPIDNLPLGSALAGGDDFTGALSTLLPFGYFLFLMAKGAKRILLMGISGILAATIVLVGSRGGFLGLGAVVMTLLILSPNKKVTYSMSVAGFVCLLFFAPAQFFSEVKTITDTNESTAHHRLSMWKDGLDIFFNNPITGIGLMNFPSYHGHYYVLTGVSSSRTARWKVAHSDPVTVLCELGLLGFTIYGLIVCRALKMNFGRIQLLKIHGMKMSEFFFLSYALIVGFVGYGMCSVFLTMIYYPHLYILCALTVCLSNLSRKELDNLRI